MFFVVLLLWGATQQVFASGSSAAAAPDSNVVHVRNFNQEQLAAYAKDRHFQYRENKEHFNWWQRFWSWVWYNLRKIFDGIRIGHGTWNVLKYALLMVAIAFIVFLALKLAGVDLIKVITGKSTKTDLPYTEVTEDIHEINFEGEIEKAMSARNYRLAVRLLYLRSLKYLSDAHLIEWHIEKTNEDYLRELAGAPQHNLFSMLTHQFEYVWYGDFPVDAQKFQRINELFLKLKTQLP